MIESNPLQRSSCQETKTCSVSVERSPTCTPTVVKVEPERLGLAVAQSERGGGFGGVEQLSRYLDLMRRDTLMGTVHGSSLPS